MGRIAPDRSRRLQGRLISGVARGAVLLLGASISLAAAPTLLVAQEVTAIDEAQIVDWIQQLGDESFATRQRAESALLSAGSQAIPLLQATAQWSNTGDHEVQLRAQRLVALLKQRRQEERIAAFRSGEQTLPGWEGYQKRVGSAPSHRQLYALMYQSAPRLLEHADNSEDVVAELETLLPGIYPLLATEPDQALGQLAATLYAGLRHVPGAASGQDGGASGRLTDSQLTAISTQLSRSGIVREIKRSELREPLLKLAATWVSAIPQRAPFYQQKLRCMSSIDDELMAPVLRELLVDRDLPPSLRAMAAIALSQLHCDLARQTFASLQNDDQVVARFLVNSNSLDETSATPPEILEVQIRDLCLLAQLIDQSRPPTDFGFRSDSVADGQINIKRAGFASPEIRQQALEKAQISE